MDICCYGNGRKQSSSTSQSKPDVSLTNSEKHDSEDSKVQSIATASLPLQPTSQTDDTTPHPRSHSDLTSALPGSHSDRTSSHLRSLSEDNMESRHIAVSTPVPSPDLHGSDSPLPQDQYTDSSLPQTLLSHSTPSRSHESSPLPTDSQSPLPRNQRLNVPSSRVPPGHASRRSSSEKKSALVSQARKTSHQRHVSFSHQADKPTDPIQGDKKSLIDPNKKQAMQTSMIKLSQQLNSPNPNISSLRTELNILSHHVETLKKTLKEQLKHEANEL